MQHVGNMHARIPRIKSSSSALQLITLNHPLGMKLTESVNPNHIYLGFSVSQAVLLNPNILETHSALFVSRISRDDVFLFLFVAGKDSHVR